MKTVVSAPIRLLVADEVWIATALLHREHPERKDFTVKEIVERARSEKLSGSLRPGVQVHAFQHCVANRDPNPATYRMLYATGKNTRRLYREGDDVHPRRKGKITPSLEYLPEKYRFLLEWYRTEYAPPQDQWLQRIKKLAGAGREIFAGVDPDQYVRQLREGWS